MKDILIAVIGGIIVIAGIAWGIVWESKPSCKDNEEEGKTE